MTSLAETIIQTYLLCIRSPQGEPIFPRIEVPPYGERSEGSRDPFLVVINEPRPEHLPKPSKKNGAISFCNHPASPHTPKTFELYDVQYPAHIVVWWYGESDKTNKYPTIIDLAQMKTEDRKPFLEVITAQIENAVIFLREQNPNIKLDEIYRHIEIYGLGGHTKSDERIKNGLSRGAQSHPMGHINVVYHPYQEYQKLAKEKPTNPREFLKQTGSMDTVVFDRWQAVISNIIRKIISKNDLKANVISTKTYKIGEKCSSFYEGLTIEFTSSQNLVNSLEILCQIINFFQGIYDILRIGYDQYYQQIGDGKEKLSEIKKEIFDSIKLHFNSQLLILNEETIRFDEFFNELIDFTLSFHPTYQQLLLWRNLDDVSQQTKNHLARMQKTYEKIQEINKNPEKKQRLIKWLQNFYGFSPFEAEAYFQFFNDMTSSTSGDQWKNIQFTWASQLSFSYLIDKYIIDKSGNIQVNEFTIAPRFFTNKGVFEDLAGMIIDRPQGI